MGSLARFWFLLALAIPAVVPWAGPAEPSVADHVAFK